ncbi:hypothetical protein [Halalkalicoccus tibetensis]|uniref:Uncharacterized protein n=1 Tax=Halalkalicoccus tibetensis TaxID=175632 RepID=A0ABD5V6L4_9EURY
MSEPPGMAVGMEIEYWVVDSDGRPCAGEEVVAAHDRICHARTSPRSNPGAVRRSRASRRR